MRMPQIRFGTGMLLGWLLMVATVSGQENTTLIDPRSDSGLDYYAQGGVALDGIAYFTSTDGSRRPGVRKTEDFPAVVAFDINNFKTVKTYPFAQTYDSSPLVIQKKDGTWLVLAHEHKNRRTVAMNRDTAEVEWISESNQPGAYFFGYSCYMRQDGSKLILMACTNGLHAMSSETGGDVWWVRKPSTGGITPCVDQTGGLIYYQCNGQVLKIRAIDGQVLKSVDVAKPNTCISWNTVLVSDSHGDFVATRWYGKPVWDSAIRVYDRDLNLVWEKTGLPNGKKDTLTYAEGNLVTGCGNGWAKTRSEGKRTATEPPPESRNWPPQYLQGFFDRHNWTFLYEGTSGNASRPIRSRRVKSPGNAICPSTTSAPLATCPTSTATCTAKTAAGRRRRPKAFVSICQTASWRKCSTMVERSRPAPPTSSPTARSSAATSGRMESQLPR